MFVFVDDERGKALKKENLKRKKSTKIKQNTNQKPQLRINYFISLKKNKMSNVITLRRMTKTNNYLEKTPKTPNLTTRMLTH